MQPTATSTGIVTRPSGHSVDEVVDRVQALLAERGIKLFALVDHSGEAAMAGLSMPPTKLLIFGNPAGGTPVMLAAPTTAIDLPLKLLVWQDPGGQTRLSYNDPQYLQERHRFPPALLRNLGLVEWLAEQASR